MTTIHEKFEAAKSRIGETILYDIGGPGELAFHCVIFGAKSAYGKVFFLIKPVAGSGSKWTSKLGVPEAADGADIK